MRYFSHFLVSPKIRLFSSHFPSHFWTRTYPKAPETVHFNVCKVLIGKESDQLKPISKPPPSASRPPLRRCGISFYHWGLPVWCTLPLSLHPRANTLPVIMKRQSLRYAERFLAPGHLFRMASPQAEFSPSSSNRKLILAGQIAFIPTGILTTLLGPMLPILIARWAMNDTQAGNLFLVQFLASLVGVQLAGVLLTRWGFRPAFLLGLLLMACGVATLYMGSLGLGLASVAAYGLGLGLIIPTNNLLIAEIGSSSSAGQSAGQSSGDSSGDSSRASSRASSSASAVSLLNFFWGVGAVLCSLMVAWTAAHRLLPFFLGAVALFLVLLALAR